MMGQTADISNKKRKRCITDKVTKQDAGHYAH
jgi:hypothetical protein